ncbi:hypothetical protein INT47_001470 [Mucor saturninus]|uniref:Uncharacterized protein n=1 Tax=Mucor saturninus TaxID=64648 RepID=A0A8H7R1F8_9FUNG|nr:hypothetical protein INT47_001470 [Mucor saturninus]
MLPWFMFPVKYQHALKRIVPLAQLGKLLQRLPPLSLSSTWSARWFLGLPLQCVTTDNLQNTRVVNASKVKEVRRALYPSDGWFAATGFLPTALHNQSNRDVLLPTWLPALYHWTIPQGRGNMVTVSGIRPGNLRWYWHPDCAKFEIRAVIPQVVPTRFLLRPSLWRLFWSLDMTSKAFTPWWRLLQDSMEFVQGIFNARYTLYKTKQNIKERESIFNDLYIYPFLKITANVLCETREQSGSEFTVGEEPLKAMSTQLDFAGLHQDDAGQYKADGIIALYGIHRLEILLLETSSHFGCTDSSKISFGHHKSLHCK